MKPRVISKLQLCFLPMGIVSPSASDITGLGVRRFQKSKHSKKNVLDNYVLENQRRFDAETVQLINKFLARFEEPVCLIAHNGDKVTVRDIT